MVGNFKRIDYFKLTGQDRVKFDARVRRDQMPFLSRENAVRDLGPAAVENARRQDAARRFTALEALTTIVADDLARSYWGKVEFAGAGRLAATGLARLRSRADALVSETRSEELWLGAVLLRAPAHQIAEGEDTNTDLIEGVESPMLATLPEIFDAALSDSLDGEPARLLVTNVSAAFRLLRARAREHGLTGPADAHGFFVEEDS